MPKIKPHPAGMLAESSQVVAWEKDVAEAETHDEAQTQLLYLQLLQLRIIKLILIWVLIIIPIAVTVGLVVLLNIDAPEPTGFYR